MHWEMACRCAATEAPLSVAPSHLMAAARPALNAEHSCHHCVAPTSAIGLLVCYRLPMANWRLPQVQAQPPAPAIGAGYIGEIVPWDNAVWRLCAVVIGVGINLASSSLIFPVTGRRAVKHKVEVGSSGRAHM